ncbi:MAG: phospholipase D-like domain-containing protein [Candidatus Helarchaeota archaeon]
MANKKKKKKKKKEKIEKKETFDQKSKEKTLKDILKTPEEYKPRIINIIEKNDRIIQYCIIPHKDSKSNIIDDIFDTNSIIYTNVSEDINLHKIVLKLIDSAKEIICICSFIIQHNTDVVKRLFEKSKEGVRIYFLVASENQIKKQTQDIQDTRAEEHIEFLKDAKGYMYIRTADHFHSKFIIIDPHLDSRAGIILTSNLTERALKENREIGVLLNKEEVLELWNQFLYGFWHEAQHELISRDNKLIRVEPSDLSIPNFTRSIIWTLNEHRLIKEKLKELLSSINDDTSKLKHEVLISSWNIVNDNEITELIIELSKRVKMKVIISEREKNYSVIKDLIDNNIEIKLHQLQHAKFIISNNEAIIFSANIESLGLNSGFETGYILRDLKNIEILKRIFNYWWNNPEYIAKKDVPIENIIGKTIIDLNKKEKYKIEKEKLIRKNYFNTLIYLDSNEEKVKKIIGRKLELNRYIDQNALFTKFQITINPNKKITNNANVIKLIEGFPIIEEGNKEYIVITKAFVKTSKKMEKLQEIYNNNEFEIAIWVK